jgi:hypothetical protein
MTSWQPRDSRRLIQEATHINDRRIPPPHACGTDDESTLGELRARIQTAIIFIESITPEKINGSEEREVLLPLGPDHSMTFTGQAFLTGFALPNFFFHASMAYALLRQGGVDIGKMDFLGAP